MKALIGAAMLALTTISPAAQETKLGAGVTLTDATPIASVVNHPDQFVGKTIRVDGVATAVCTGNGCWVAIAEEAKADAKTVRVKVEDGVIVIPVTAKGKRISAQGVLELVSDEHGKEAAGEHAKHDAKATKTYQLKGTGVVIR